jgi:hypothetical protein
MATQVTLPIALKWEIFSVLTNDVRRQIEKRGLSEAEIVADFDSWRKSKRETCRRTPRSRRRDILD